MSKVGGVLASSFLICISDKWHSTFYFLTLSEIHVLCFLYNIPILTILSYFLWINETTFKMVCVQPTQSALKLTEEDWQQELGQSQGPDCLEGSLGMVATVKNFVYQGRREMKPLSWGKSCIFPWASQWGRRMGKHLWEKEGQACIPRAFDPGPTLQ